MRREAYFLDFVPKLRAKVSIPVMVTGGFRTVAAMERPSPMTAWIWSALAAHW